MTKKKESIIHTSWCHMPKPRDLTIESFKKPEEPYVVASYRLKPQCIDESPTVRMYQPPMHYDAFLNYLEWKMDRPWYKRLFLP